MAVFTVSYDLRSPNRNYSLLYEKIKSCGVWWHYLESTWMVDTTKSANEIAEILRPAIDSNDSLLIVNIGRDYAGWLEEKAWEWIRIHSQAA